MAVLKILFRILENSKYAFFFSLGVYFSSLILNTSFRVMGFDLSSQIDSVMNPDFGLVILFTNLKIFLLYYLFYASIEFFLSPIFKSRNLNRKWLFVVFGCISLFLWMGSVVHYPQMYADFFYGKHPYLRFLLHALTDFFPVAGNSFLIGFTFLIGLGYFSWILIYKNKFNYLFLILYAILGYIFHLHGNIYGICITFMVCKILYKENWKIQRLFYIPIFLVILLFLVSYYYIFYSFSLPSQTEKKQFHLFLISADSLRYDSIGKIVDGKSLTPQIDEFRKTSFQFHDHHVTIPRTFPSWADLLTGKYSMSHKIRDMFPAPEEAKNLGKGEYLTLGHYLAAQDFRTAVFSNFAGDIFPRADFGFKHIETPNFNAKILIVQKAIESQIFLIPILTGALLGGGNYFEEMDSFAGLGDGQRIHNNLFPYLKLHKNNNLFITAFHSVIHFPYSPPHPFYKKFGDQDYYGKYKYFKFVDPTSNEKPSLQDIEQIRAIYYASVNAFDANFGEFISKLKEEGIFENSIIILTGDHGESLYEDIHGQGHGEHLRGEYVTHVPLIIKTPKIMEDELTKDCKRDNCLDFKGITSHIDVLPTILDLYKIEPQSELPGKNIFSNLAQGNWTKEKFVYAETGIWFSDIGDHFFQSQRIKYPNILQLHRIVPEHNYQIMITDLIYRDTIAFSKHRALMSNQYKLLYIPTHDGVVFEFYDRIKDPENKVNLYPNYLSETYKRELYNLSKKWENSKVISDYIFPPSLEESLGE